MAKINQETIKTLKDAHLFFQKKEGANAYIKYRESDERYIDYLVEKNSWYRGEGYHLWSSGTYVATFDPAWIEALLLSS